MTISTYTTGDRAEMTRQLGSCTVKKRVLSSIYWIYCIICFVNSSVIQPFCILLQWVLINSHYYLKKLNDATTTRRTNSNGIKRKLKLQFKKERDLQRKSSEEKASDVEVIPGKKQMSRKRTEKKDSLEYSIFRTPAKNETFSVGIYVKLSSTEWQGMFFSFRDSPWNLVNGSVYAANTETPNKWLVMTCSKVPSCCMKSQNNKNLHQRCKRQTRLRPCIMFKDFYSKLSEVMSSADTDSFLRRNADLTLRYWICRTCILLRPLR